MYQSSGDQKCRRTGVVELEHLAADPAGVVVFGQLRHDLAKHRGQLSPGALAALLGAEVRAIPAGTGDSGHQAQVLGQVIPGGGHEAKGMRAVGGLAHGLVVAVAVPGADDGVEAVLHEVLHGGGLGLGQAVLPVGDDDAPVEQGQRLVGALVGAGGGDVRVLPDGGVEQLVTPDDRAAALRGQLPGQLVEVVGQQLSGVLAAADRTGGVGIGLVAAQVEIFAAAAQLDQLLPECAQHAAGLGIADAPGPTVRLEQQRPARVLVEHDVLAVAAAALGGVAQVVEHRDDLHAQILYQAHQRADLFLGIGVFRPGQLGQRVVAHRAPELEHDVGELHHAGQANGLFKQYERGLGEHAQVDGAHAGNRGVVVNLHGGQGVVRPVVKRDRHHQLHQREQAVQQSHRALAAHERALFRHGQGVLVAGAQRGAVVFGRAQHGAVFLQALVAHHAQGVFPHAVAVPQSLVFLNHALGQQRGVDAQGGLRAEVEFPGLRGHADRNRHQVAQNHVLFPP